jgi:hypothetical protein
MKISNRGGRCRGPPTPLKPVDSSRPAITFSTHPNSSLELWVGVSRLIHKS